MARRRWPTAVSGVAAAAAAIALACAPAHAADEPIVAGMESGTFAEFAHTNERHGALTVSVTNAYDGLRAAQALYSSPDGSNGFARAVQDADWAPGETVTYGMAVYLPAGFTAAVQGAVSLMRWDNWSLYGPRGDIGGLVIWGSDKRLHLVRGTYAGGYDADLVAPIELPERRWVHLEVRQRLSAAAEAINEAYVDGRLAGRSAAANMSDRPITCLRYGLVSIAAGTQTRPLKLLFDRASIGSRLTGPADAAAVAPVFTAFGGAFAELSGLGDRGAQRAAASPDPSCGELDPNVHAG